MYFDYGSPYSYLAYERVVHVHPDRYRKHRVTWKPVSAAHIFRRDGRLPNAQVPNLKRNMLGDVARWAKRYGVPFAPPPDGTPGEMPVRSIEALRLHFEAAAAGPETEAAWMDAVFHAYFHDGKNIADLAELRRLAADVGLVVKVDDAVTRDENKSRLVASTDEAYAAGAPGVPFAVVGGQGFWGNDRFDWVEGLLAKR